MNDELKEVITEMWEQNRSNTEDVFTLKEFLEEIEKIMDKTLKAKYPRLSIERYLMDANGHVTGVDLHDEKFGEAIFFNDGGSRHGHGFMNKGQYQGKND